ncbi:MAG: hypothetical protein IT162_07085, partial [Bryobacterales bacterium]|nr:hypothetical protein [Bryobacterales bacterium]
MGGLLGAMPAVLFCWQPATVQFVDVATKWGITAANTFGGVDRKDFILETTG